MAELAEMATEAAVVASPAAGRGPWRCRGWGAAEGSELICPCDVFPSVLVPGPALMSSIALISRCCLWWPSRSPPSRRHSSNG